MSASRLKFFSHDTGAPSDCGQVLEIELSSQALPWAGVVLEKGSAPCFYPDNVYTPYFYFALALEHELHWSAETGSGKTALKTSPGDIWINPPRTPFSHHISEPCYFVILAVEERTFLQHCPLPLSGKSLQFLNNYNVHDEVIKGIIELFLIEVKAGGRNGYSYLQSLLALLGNHYILNYSNYPELQDERKTASGFGQAQVDKIDGYIIQHMGDSITVDDLADLLGCSKFHFLREFKKMMSITPYQYLLSRRMEQARMLLSSPDSSIAAVGLDLGFNDQSHFTRAFKNQFGLTPGQFQKQANDRA